MTRTLTPPSWLRVLYSALLLNPSLALNSYSPCNLNEESILISCCEKIIAEQRISRTDAQIIFLFIMRPHSEHRYKIRSDMSASAGDCYFHHYFYSFFLSCRARSTTIVCNHSSAGTSYLQPFCIFHNFYIYILFITLEIFI